MFVVALLMTAGALLLAFGLARQISAPLLQLNEELKSGTDDKSQLRFSASNRIDEIGFLARSLGQSLQSLQEALKRESLFTRDISHELRTPVTIIKNLLHHDEGTTFTNDDHQLFIASVNEIDHTLETLFALARAENLALQETDLVSYLEQAILNLEKTAQAHQLHFTVELDEAIFDQKYSAMANPHLLSLLFNNLLNNALFHGGDRVVIKIRLETRSLVIGNSIAPQALMYASGFTHGKNLLQRIVQALHWEIYFQSRDNYFEASIQLK